MNNKEKECEFYLKDDIKHFGECRLYMSKNCPNIDCRDNPNCEHKQLQTTKQQLEEAATYLEHFLPQEDCRFDHNGYCQEHNYMTVGCPHSNAKKFLATLQGDER